MQVFRCALRIIRRNFVYLLVYVVALSFMGVGMASSFNLQPSDEYERVRLDYALIDRDGSAVSRAVDEFMSLYGERVDVTDDAQALQDAVAKNAVEYVLVIPAGYGAAFEDAARRGDALPTMDATYSYLAASGILFDSNLDNCMGMLATRMFAYPDVGVVEAADAVLADAAETADVEVLSSDAIVSQSDRFVFYLQFSSYGVFASIIVCVGVVISTMRRTDVRRRQACAPVTPVVHNAQMALASLIVVLFACCWTMLLGIVVFWDSATSAGAAGLALMGLSLFAFALVPLGVAFFIGTLGASSAMANAIGNIVGLVISFLGGAWMPLEFTAEPVRIAATFLPGIWYIDSLDVAVDIAAGANLVGTYGADLAVLLLYAALFLLLGLLAGRLRIRSRA